MIRRIGEVLRTSAPDGGMPISEVVVATGFSENTVEQLHTRGKLGAASSLLQCACKQCGEVISFDKRRGHYCGSCSQAVSQKAGVTIQPRPQVESRQEREREIKSIRELQQQKQQVLQQNSIMHRYRREP